MASILNCHGTVKRNSCTGKQGGWGRERRSERESGRGRGGQKRRVGEGVEVEEGGEGTKRKSEREVGRKM